MERKLASIQQIRNVRIHPNADNLELVDILGWQCIARKGEFVRGDLCVYFEIDSVLPVREEFEFLRKSCYVKKDWVEGFRLRTIKLRKELSQGLAMPLNSISWPHALPKKEEIIGTDVTGVLGVVKWDPPVPTQLAGQVLRNFPSFIPKTDQERVQNCYFDLLRDNYFDMFEATLKLDGSSCTVYYKDGQLGVCSRNLELKINEENKDNIFVRVARHLEPYLKTLHVHAAHNHVMNLNIALQGEVMGPGIQGNSEGFNTPHFFVFDVYNIEKQCYLTAENRYQFLDELRYVNPIGMYDSEDVVGDNVVVQHVPVIDPAVPFNTFKQVADFLRYADRRSINAEIAEGVVFKCLRDPSISFKVINNKYLLEKEI